MTINPMVTAVERRLVAFSEWRRRWPWLDGEVLFAALTLLLSAYFLYQSYRLGLTNGVQAAAGTFPALVSAGLVVCSGVWLYGTLLRLRRSSATTDQDPAEDRLTESNTGATAIAPKSESATWRVLFVVVWSALLLPLTEAVGMVPMLLVYLTGLFWIVARTSIWKAAIIIAVVLALFAWGAYEARIYLPDPLRIGRTIHTLFSGFFG